MEVKASRVGVCSLGKFALQPWAVEVMLHRKCVSYELHFKKDSNTKLLSSLNTFLLVLGEEN